MLKSLKYIILLIIAFSSGSEGKLFAQNWESLGNGTNFLASELYTDTVSNRLYAIGTFTFADDTLDVGGVAYWDGIKWNDLDSGNTECPSCNPIKRIASFQGNVYIGGTFTSFHNVPNTRCIARFNGTNWETVGNADGAMDFYHYNSQLLAYGQFDTIGGVYARSLALYDGLNWGIFDTATFIVNQGDFIATVVEYNGELYAGGSFDYANGVEEIAKFDGNQWVSVGGGILGNAWVNKMVVYQNELYVAGFFHKSAGNAGNGIMKWNGTNWSDLNNGLALTFGGQIKDMKVHNGELIVLGWMALADGIPTQNLAKWDGTKWCNFRNSFDGTAEAIEIYNNEIVVSCRDSMDLEPVKYIAKWIGGNQSDSCGVVGIEAISLANGIAIYPNPNNGNFTIELDHLENATIKVYNIAGQLILQKSLLQHITKIDLTTYRKGVYFVTLNLNGNTYSSKFIKQ